MLKLVFLFFSLTAFADTTKTFQTNQNAKTNVLVKNMSTGSSAYAQVQIQSNAGTLTLDSSNASRGWDSSKFAEINATDSTFTGGLKIYAHNAIDLFNDQDTNYPTYPSVELNSNSLDMHQSTYNLINHGVSATTVTTHWDGFTEKHEADHDAVTQIEVNNQNSTSNAVGRVTASTPAGRITMDTAYATKGWDSTKYAEIFALDTALTGGLRYFSGHGHSWFVSVPLGVGSPPFPDVTTVTPAMYLDNTGTLFYRQGIQAINNSVTQLNQNPLQGVGYLSTQLVNGGVGTIDKKVVKLDSSGNATQVATSDTSGAIGIVQSAPVSSPVEVGISGQVQCAFDGATTLGDWVQISSTTTGDCHDAGSTWPASGQVLGKVLSTNASGGTYSLIMREEVTKHSNTNLASSLVARDSSGNFSAGTITATLSGTATNSTNAAITNDTSTNSTFYPTFVAASSGNNPLTVTNSGSASLSFNPSTGTLATLRFGDANSAFYINRDDTTSTAFAIAYSSFNGSSGAAVLKSEANFAFNPGTSTFYAPKISATLNGGAGNAAEFPLEVQKAQNAFGLSNYGSAANTNPAQFFRYARGNIGSASASQSGDHLGQISYQGYGTSFQTGAVSDALTTELWTATAHGTKLRFLTTPNGSQTNTLALTLDQDQSATFANTVNATTFAGNHTGSIAGTTVSGTTGTTNVVFSSSPTIASPTITGTTTLSSTPLINSAGSYSLQYGGTSVATINSAQLQIVGAGGSTPSLGIGTATAISAATELVSILDSNTTSQTGGQRALQVRSQLTTSSANTTQLQGIVTSPYRKGTTSNSTESASIIGLVAQPAIDFDAGATYTNTGIMIGVSVPALSNINSSTLAITDLRGISVSANSLSTGTTKTGIFVGAQTGATNNALIADNTTYSGSFGINFTGSNPTNNLGSGATTMGSATITNAFTAGAASTITTSSGVTALTLDSSGVTNGASLIMKNGGTTYAAIHTDAQTESGATTDAAFTGVNNLFLVPNNGSGAHHLKLATTGLATFTDGVIVGGNTTSDSGFSTGTSSISSVTNSSYYVGSFTPTFSGAFTTNVTATAITYVKHGRVVTLDVPSISGACSHASTITTAAGDIPANLRPNNAIQWVPEVFTDGGSDQVGRLTISTAGTLVVFATAAGGNFGTTSTCGWDRAIEITYVSGN